MLLKPLLKAIPAITLTLFSGLAYGDLVWENATLEQKARLDSFYQSLNRHQKQRLESMDPKKRSKIQRHIGGLSKYEQKALVNRNHKALINTDINNTKALKLQSMQAISIAQPGSAQLPINRMVQDSNEPIAIPTSAATNHQIRGAASNLHQLGAGIVPELPLNTTQYRLPAIDTLPPISDTPVLNSLPSIQDVPVLNSLPSISNLPVTSQLPTNTEVVPQILSIPTQILTPEQREQTINTIILDPLNNIRNHIKQDIRDILRIK